MYSHERHYKDYVRRRVAADDGARFVLSRAETREVLKDLEKNNGWFETRSAVYNSRPRIKDKEEDDEPAPQFKMGPRVENRLNATRYLPSSAEEFFGIPDNYVEFVDIDACALLLCQKEAKNVLRRESNRGAFLAYQPTQGLGKNK